MPELRPHRLLRLSLAFVWLATALVSALERNGQSRQLLDVAGIGGSAMAPALIWAGIAVDAVLGLALLLKPGRATCLAALGMMIVMTLVATVLLPALWLDPLGPLTKNVPIAALLWFLARERI